MICNVSLFRWGFQSTYGAGMLHVETGKGAVICGCAVQDCLEGKELNREKLNLRGREAMKKHQYRKMMQLQNPNFYKKGSCYVKQHPLR